MLFSRKFKKNEPREEREEGQIELCKASGVLKDLLIYGGDASAKRRGAILEERARVWERGRGGNHP